MHQCRKKAIESMLPELRHLTSLPDDTEQKDVLDALITQNHSLEATELIFGTRRDSRESVLSNDEIGWHFFMSLWCGRHPQLTRQIAQHHHWETGSTPAKEGYSMQVYPNDWLVIEEPTATQALKAMFK